MKRGLLVLAGLGLAGMTATGATATYLHDTITVVDAAGQILVNGVTLYVTGNRWSGCFCHSLEGQNRNVGNATPGPSQVAVLSQGYALYFDPNVQWTYGADELTAKLRPLTKVPLIIWKLSTIETTSAADAVFAARQLRGQQTGIELAYTIRDVMEADIKKELGCADLAALATTKDPKDPTRTLFDPAAINVYYVDSCGVGCGESGASCKSDPRAGFVYPIGDNGVLIHELGHALLGTQGSLHWQWSMGRDNIMNDYSAPTRSTISTGQAVTMNYEATSVLTKLGLLAKGLDCRVDCPRIEFDISWSECRAPATGGTEPLDAVDAWLDCLECSEGQLERILNEWPSDGTVFNRLRVGLQANPGPGPLAPPTEPVYRANAIARHQLRSLRALEIMAIRQHAGARTTIIDASRSIALYRTDVQAAIQLAVVAIQ